MTTISAGRLMCGLMVGVLAVHAQFPAHQELGQGVLASNRHVGRAVIPRVRIPQDSIPLPSITTDTGSFAPGNKDFSRFANPGICLGAVEELREVARRSVAAQLTHLFQDSVYTGDTLPMRVVNIARVCASRFTVAGTAAIDLPDLFTLALIAGRDSLARAVVSHRLALAVNPAVQDSVRQEAIDGYLRAEPSRVAAAESTVAQVDALGPQEQAARLMAHASLLMLARRSFDERRMHEEAGRIIELEQAVPETNAIRYHYEPVCGAYAALEEIAVVEYPDSLLAIAARAKKDLDRFPSGFAFPEGISFEGCAAFNFKSRTVKDWRDFFVPSNAEQYAGKPFPPVEARFWFPKPPGSWPPGNGHPSLIIYGDELLNNCTRDDDMILGNVIRGNCSDLYTYVPRWTQQFGGRISITLVSPTHGYAVRSLALSPAAETDSLRWFLQTHLKLPVIVGVVEDSVWQLPTPDGRKFQRDTTFYGHFWDKKYGPMRPGNDAAGMVLFYDAHGTLRYVGGFDPTLLRKLIDRALDVSSSALLRPVTP